MGKPIKESYMELEKSTKFIQYHIDNAEKFLNPEEVKTSVDKSYIAYQPLGPLVLYQPWNFPIWLVMKTVIPQLLVGNTALVKSSSQTPLCGLELERLFQEAGFPKGVYQYFPINYKDGERAIASKKVRGCSLTGSGKAGQSVGEYCGKHLKKCVMELGGADPLIVLEDADLDKAAKVGVSARMRNNAQACTNAKRFIVHESVYDEFKEKVIEQLKTFVKGDPMDENTTLGPLSKVAAVETLRKQVRESIEKGAKVGYGDQEQLTQEIDPSQGAFFTPMILEDFPKDSPAYHDELFGPVVCMFKFSTDQEAIDIANDHEYGLGGGVWSRDWQRAEKIALEIESGMVYVNDKGGHIQLPAGGCKNSGFGREGGPQGIREFVNIKSVSIVTQ
jgi:succinate-semialdehyde dehydrogenase/glutarate-semialdehyde dehydrogenase